ncbi:Uncharacterised protein [Chryseobacterium nakagawai]|uniref:Uncharacterized protein n=1 Tax=Chryseobacterium nakagawai TaxID=1241982 RepID=A0AAD0YIF6_CHRNA|nr:hypothetical protein [Chryseobacterium nakagawai]AZA90457.1 hypothetical protein EG343_07415 [Chryseobacterium nakagawai]VEH21956.1 Uncharacterised protein [Chryseobacterium nakagawai]
MSDQNYRAIKLLEYIKYKTVKRQVDPNVIEHLGFSGMGESDIYVSKDSDLVMPEGFTINFKLIRFNWASTAFDGAGNIINARKALYFEFSNGTNGLLKENWYKIFTRNGVEYRRYIFNSNFYKEQVQKDPNGVANWINTYDNQNYIESNDGGGDFPMSAVITIKNDDINRGRFEQFMKMSYTDWSVYFNNKLQRFLLNGEAGLFDFYPTQVIVSHLSKGTAGNVDNSKLIQVLQKIGHGWGNNIGELSGERRTRILLDILSQIKPENAKDIYDEFFNTPSEIFYNSLLGYMDEDYRIQFILMLLRLFYKQMSQQDLQAYENKIVNLKKDNILPFIKKGIKAPNAKTAVDIGPFPEIETSGSGILLKRVRFYTYKADDPSRKELLGTDNPFNHLQNKTYAFNEVIGALACFDNQDLGFMQLNVYPIPAFAFETFHKTTSSYYKFKDLINELAVSACIVFPYFRIVQLEAVASNIISLVFGGFGAVLTDDFKNYLNNLSNTPSDPHGYGKKFVLMYTLCSNFWVIKDLTIVAIENVKDLIDVENLLSIWGLLQTADSFKNGKQQHKEAFDEVIKTMDIMKLKYEIAKKKNKI